MNIKALRIDIAKNVFELHGVDKNGKTVLKKRVSRDKLPEGFCRNFKDSLLKLAPENTGWSLICDQL